MFRFFSVILFSLTLLTLAASGFAEVASLSVHNNTSPALRRGALIVAPAPRNQKMRISVALRIERPTLDSLIQQLYDPTSAQYRHFLTRDQFVTQFGTNPKAYGAVIDFLKSRGIQVTATYRNRMLIDAEGTVAQVERAFDVKMNSYVSAGGRSFVANDRDPRLPAEIAGTVAAITGLDDYAQVRSHAQESRAAAAAVGGVPTGYYPSRIQAAYDFAPLYASGNDGSGATIAIATAYGFNADDVNAYWQYFGIQASNYSVVHVGGASHRKSLETTLDLEQTAAFAPGASVIVYEAGRTTAGAFQRLYNRIVSDDRATVVTTSWGICEQEMPPAVIQADSGIFAEAAAQGQAWFAAAGDNGAYDCGDPKLAVDYPASDPNVASANGTTLNLADDGSIAAERAWQGSGGGLSIEFAEPFYQSGTGLLNIYSNGMRQAADVAFNSDPLTGYPVLYQRTWSEYGGTSFAAPAWAAIFALVNAARGDAGPVGAAAPNLYALVNGELAQSYPAFHDIVSGTNSFYPALAGWDYATGWGSPDVANIVLDLASD